MYLDFGKHGLQPGLLSSSGCMLVKSLDYRISYDRPHEVEITGYYMEGSHPMSYLDRCHLCEAQLVEEQSSVIVDPETDERTTSRRLRFECGTTIDRASDRRLNIVKLGEKCVQLPKA